MLMVVFGAGASYDSVPAIPPGHEPLQHARPRYHSNRPPLAKELFDDRPLFNEAVRNCQKCQPIIPYLQGSSVQVEQELEKMQSVADQYPQRYRQLAAVRYYLHSMLLACVEKWNAEAPGGVTNYKTFLDQLEEFRDPQESICLVTFNYDTMLEDALSVLGVNIRTITDYTAGHRYKLIKLHGSVNWGRKLDTPIENLETLNRNFLFGLPAIENIHASASQRVQCFLREDHQLRASLSGSPKTVQSASKPSFFRQLSIPGG